MAAVEDPPVVDIVGGRIEVEWAAKGAEYATVTTLRLSPIGAVQLAERLLAVYVKYTEEVPF